MTGPEAHLSVKALSNNYSILAKLNRKGTLICVLKANAYGHGATEVLQVLEKFGVTVIAVARVCEAKELREVNSNVRIIILQGAPLEDWVWCSENNVELVIHNYHDVNSVTSCDFSYKISVWVKVNLGMNRLGIERDDLVSVIKKILDRKNVEIKGVIGHFSSADLGARGSAMTEQIEFTSLTEHCKQFSKSLYNSSAVLGSLRPRQDFEYERVGLALYGVSPVQQTLKCDAQKLQPVMSFIAPLISIRKISKGEAVSYHGTWVSPRDTKIGVIAAGYGDGYPQNVEGAFVFLNGRRCAVVGVVCMDMMMVELGLDSNDELGDIAVLWGKEVHISEIARAANSTPYELFTRVAARVRRVIVH
ncbi:alanine racemase [Pseudoalteromonas maricaloris]